MKRTEEQADSRVNREWIEVLEILKYPIFIHDGAFRILRCNRAYAQHAGIPVEEIIGQPYYDIFPKVGKPLSNCLHALERPVPEGEEQIVQSGGAYYRSLAYAVTDKSNRYLYSVHILEDITKRRKAEILLEKERDFSGTLVETAQVIILILDPRGHILRFNRYMETLSGYTLNEVKGRDWFDIFLPDATRQKTREIFLEAINDIDTQGQIDTLVTRNGDILQIKWYSKTVKGNDGRTEGLLAIGMDVTEQREAQKRLELFHTMFEHSRDAVEIIEPLTLRFLDVNETLCRELGYSRDELLGMRVYDIDPILTPERSQILETRVREEGSITFETLHKRRNGSTYPMEISLSIVDVGNLYLLAIARDISERQEAEEALRQSEEKFRSMSASAQDAILMMDEDGKISYWNDAAEKMFGYSADETMGHLLHHLLAPERFLDAYDKGFAHFIRTGKGAAVGKTLELAAIRKDGTEFPIELSMSSIRRKKKWNAIGIIRDISDRKEAEAALKHANRALRTLSEANLALVRAENETALLKEVTKVIVEKGGYSLAVVDYTEHDPGKHLAPAAWSGFEGEDYWMHGMCWGETARGTFPPAVAIRSGTTQICRTIADPSTCPVWREAALARGYVSNIALPLFEKGNAFGALSIYSAEAEPFDDEEVTLLEELAGDLAYGIINLRTRAAHEQHEHLLREGLEQSIQAIAATVETRDPYTAGHQKRVAELAAAIAQQMGLDEEEIEGIRFAAIIHDLGKIHIPAEILSKPGKLSDLEYQLIQTHPQAGYDIVKNIKFPWPIAQIILQHHERPDGQGYPQGLKDGDILTGAKIISVADTVEAMSSHRPYRSARGLKAALQEIKRGRGTHFDPAVVDACTKLFTEKRFAFGPPPL